MKMANEHQQLQLHQQHQSPSFQPSYSSFSPDGRFKARKRPRMYPSYSNNISHYLNDFSFLSPFPPFPTLTFLRPPLPLLLPPPCPTISNFYTSTITSPFAQPPPKPEAPNFTLPSQILGVNLNLHPFNSSKPTLLLNNDTDPTLLSNNNTLDSTLLLDNNTLDPTYLHDNNILDHTHMLNNNTLDPTLVVNNNILDPTSMLNNNNILEPTLLLDNNNSSLCSYSSPTLTFFPFVTNQDVSSIGILQGQGQGVSTVMNITQFNSTTQASRSMHVAMDEEGMEDIRALDEQHQMELDVNMSMVTSV